MYEVGWMNFDQRRLRDLSALELLGKTCFPVYLFLFWDNGTPSFTEVYLPCAIMLFTMKFE